MKRLTSKLMVMLLLTSTLFLAYNTQAAEAVGTIYIRADGSIEPSTTPIQRNRDLYTFTADIYESIVVERDHAVIDGAGHTLHGPGSNYNRGLQTDWTITSATVRNLNIEGFEVGIQLDGGTFNIYGNVIAENDYGIWGDFSDSSIFRNKITENGVGVCFGYDAGSAGGGGAGNSVYGNDISWNNVGIKDSFTSGPQSIFENNITQNTRCGIYLEYWTDYNSVYRNTIVSNGVGILLWGCSHNTLARNNITRNHGAGVALEVGGYKTEIWGCGSNVVSGNDIIANEGPGISLEASYSDSVGSVRPGNIITGNNIMANEGDGISIRSYEDYTYGVLPSSGNNITLNTIASNSLFAIEVINSSDNYIYHNDFMSNTNQIRSQGSSNVWDDGYPSGGNYWSDYEGVDADRDGIGDTPYVINRKNKDRYPLMKQWSPTIFKDGFESGSFGKWSNRATSLGETATVSTTRFHHGTHSAKFTSNGGGGYERAYCNKTILSSSELYARGYFYASRSGIADQNDRFFFIILRAGSTDVAYAGWKKTGGVVRWCLTVRDGTTNIDIFSSMSPLLNLWYCVELHWKKDAANGVAEVWVDGVLVCSGTGRNTAVYGNVNSVRCGLADIYGCASTTVFCDCVKIAASYIGPET